MKTLIIICVITLLIVAFLPWFIYRQDNHLVVSEYEYSNANIPQDFDGYKIVQLSDLHDKEFGEHQERLLSQINNIKPDAIFLTGDFATKKSVENTRILVESLSGQYEMFFAPGNHEVGCLKYDELKEIFLNNNVHTLENDIVTIDRGASSLHVIGLKDLDSYKSSESPVEEMDKALKDLTADLDGVTCLLAHRPEYIDVYSNYNINLVFSGHAHGGQFIFPFIGSVYSPDQGLFPKLTQGQHERNGTTMIISRGLGNLAPVPRLFNYPEIVVVTLRN